MELANEVPMLICINCECEVTAKVEKINASPGTIIKPPPMPNKPDKNPLKQPSNK